MERVKLDTAAVCSLCLQEWGIKKWRALLCLQICQKGQRPQATKADESTCTEVKVVRRLHQNNTVYRVFNEMLGSSNAVEPDLCKTHGFENSAYESAN
ncbi:uncharacterized [Tachysurus ichikawai]